MNSTHINDPADGGLVSPKDKSLANKFPLWNNSFACRRLREMRSHLE
jgi:hypothetical protein